MSSHVDVARRILPAAASAAKGFRSTLKRLGVPPDWKPLLESLTLASGVQAVASGVKPSEFLNGVAEAGKGLMLRDVPREDVDRMLAASDRDLRKAAVEHPDASVLFEGLSGAIRVALDRGWTQTQIEELRTLDRLSEAICEPADPAVLIQRVASDLQGHFGAATVDAGPVNGGPWTVRVNRDTCLRLQFDAPRRILPREAALLHTVATRTSAALERIARQERLRLMSLRMLEIDERERRRISRELHDDSAQTLAVIRLQLEMMELSAGEHAPDLIAQLAEARALTERTILSVRKLISDLSPAILEQLGLAAAVRQLTARFARENGIDVRLVIPEFPRADPRIELVVYRIVQECLARILKDSRAKHVKLSLTSSDGLLKVRIEDVGVAVESADPKSNDLDGIRERVALLGGSVWLQTERARRTGRRTIVEIQLPLDRKYPGPSTC